VRKVNDQMAQRHSIAATTRTIIGKESKKLRRQGMLPGVIYGPVISEPIAVTVDSRELGRMYQDYGSNYLIDVKLDGSTYTVYMRQVDIDRLHRVPLHAEFYAPNMRVEMNATIPVMLVGEPASRDGVITHGRDAIEVRGLPDALPPSFEVDISGLEEYDQAIYVRDLSTPEGVTMLTDADELVVKLAAPALIVEPEPIEEEAEAEAAPEAEAEAPADSEESDEA
jgi:large subunit ribosomal protein L25